MCKRCILCHSPNNKLVFDEGGIGIFRCLDCSHIYSSYEADQYNRDYFLQVNDDFWWNEAHSRMYDDFSQRFLEKKSGRLLDVGCGLGFFVRKAMEHPQWSVWGYEISPKAVDYGRNKLGLANIYEGKVEENNFQKNSFDIITMWDVIEHLPDPAPVLSACFESLKQGGILFIHTPNVNVQLPKAIIKKFIFGYDPHIHFLEAKDHINIYSPKTIKVLLDKYGFSNIEFIHLHPIQSVSGSKHGLLKLAKNFWFNISVIIFYLSFKRINIDNLFVVAKKERTKKINLNFLI